MVLAKHWLLIVAWLIEGLVWFVIWLAILGVVFPSKACMTDAEGRGTAQACNVEYCVTGFYDSEGKFCADIECRRPVEFVLH